MNKKALIDKLEAEYQAFVDKMVTLQPSEIIARVDVISGMHFVLEYISGEDFELSDLSVGDESLDLNSVNGLLADIYETFAFELEQDSLHRGLALAMDVVLGNLCYEQSQLDNLYDELDEDDGFEMDDMEP